MYWFVIPLILGFISNVASAFTTFYSEKWGENKRYHINCCFKRHYRNSCLGCRSWFCQSMKLQDSCMEFREYHRSLAFS